MNKHEKSNNNSYKKNIECDEELYNSIREIQHENEYYLKNPEKYKWKNSAFVEIKFKEEETKRLQRDSKGWNKKKLKKPRYNANLFDCFCCMSSRK